MPFRNTVNSPLTDAPTVSRNLKRLLQMRSTLVLCQAALVLLSFLVPEIRLHLVPMLSVIGAYAVVTIVSIIMFRSQPEISEHAYFAQLVLDVAFLTLLLYFSGGYTNPFISLFLLPLFIVSSTLPRAYAWSMAGLVLACYSLLVFFYQPLFVMMHSQAGMDFHLHLVGMWLSFVLSVALVVFFIMRMSDALREREKRLADLREKAARDELMVTLGALAAGAAHELGTPLATMAVIAGELAHDHAGDDEAESRLEILRGQIRRCRDILSQISASAGQARAEGGSRLALDAYLMQLLEQWQSIRPGTHVGLVIQEGVPPLIVADVTLSQALINLLNNAADASPDHIALACRWQESKIEIEICDEGPGLPEDLRGQLGTPFVSTKSGGRGLGLFLSNAAIERFGGSMVLTERQPHGVCVCVTLPRNDLPEEAA